MTPSHLSLLIAIAVAGPLLAEPPKNAAFVPIHTAAVRTPGAEDCSAPCTLYKIGRSIEDVYKFYQEQLAPRESNSLTFASMGTPTDRDVLAKVKVQTELDNRYLVARDGLQPGSTTPVFLKLMTSSYSEPLMPKEIGDQFKARRAQVRPGEWMAHAEFKWATRSPAREPNEIQLWLADALEKQFAGAHETRLCLCESGGWDRSAPEGQVAERSLALVGLPIYPAAKFDSEHSIREASGAVYVYLTTDAPELHPPRRAWACRES